MQKRFGVLRTVAFTTLLGCFCGALHLFNPAFEWEEATVDFRLRHRPKTPASENVGLVGIGDDDVAHPQLGAWPFPRSVHSDIIQILRATGAKHIIFDILFVEPTEAEHDEALAATIQEKPDITLGYLFDGIESEKTSNHKIVPHFLPGHRFGVDVRDSNALQGVRPVPLYRSLPTSYGSVNAPVASNGVTRHIPMLIRHDNKLYPSLALEALIKTLELSPDQIRVLPGKEIKLVDTPLGTLHIPIDDRLQYRINYTSGVDEFQLAFQYLDLHLAVTDLDHGAVVTKALSGKPVIIGNVATGSSDVVTTPIGRLPGVLAQATAIANILEGNHLRFLPGWMQILWCGIIGGLLGLILRTRSAWLTIVLAIVFAGLYGFGAYLSSQSNWMIPVLPIAEVSLISLIGMLCLQVLKSHDERDRTLKALSKYVSPSVANRALREEAFASEQPDRREITIFFSDIRGFTDWSERTEPEEVTAVLNDYLAAMTEIASRCGGTLDKFMGDCIMVVFNAPDNVADHAVRAVKMAWEMQQKIAELSEDWLSNGREPIKVGMGIHTGFATVGNFGSELFSDYTAIGNSVNLAARIESSSGAGQILISETTQTLVSAVIESSALGEREFKGVKEPVPVFEVISLLDE